MRVYGVFVAHRSRMVAEGLAAGLSRYPHLIAVGTATTASGAERMAVETDVVVLDEYLSGAAPSSRRIRGKGIRVVMLGEASQVDEEDADPDLRVSPRASLASLAAAVVPDLLPRRRGPQSLTSREQEILTLVGRGMPGKQVARHLGISPKTVEHHKTKIFSKLGVTNQTAAVRLAVEQEFGRSG